MPGVAVTLYGVPPSHPSHSARLMAEHKGVDHRMVWLLPGLHPALLRTRGFRGGTVPAAKIDGRRFQDSRRIARALDALTPQNPLFPTDPTERAAVEAAEAWGEGEFQGTPRRVFRWLAVERPELRALVAEEVGLPAPRLAGLVNAPVARYMAWKAGANDDAVRADLERLPADLDRIEELLAAGTIGGDSPNAADFQIAPTVRSLLCHDDIAPLIADRPAARWAMELMPEYPSHAPALLPEDFLAPLR